MQSGRSSSALFPELHQRWSGGLHRPIIAAADMDIPKAIDQLVHNGGWPLAPPSIDGDCSMKFDNILQTIGNTPTRINRLFGNAHQV